MGFGVCNLKCGYLAGVLGIGCVLSLSGCEETVLMEELKSPDEQLTAYVYRSNSGATTAYSYNVYLVPTVTDSEEVKLPKKSRVLQIIPRRDFDLEWESDSLLVFSYQFARDRDDETRESFILQYTNHMYWEDAGGEWQSAYFLLKPQIVGEVEN